MPSPSERRIFLTQRLLDKQITMEEATELFSLMNREIDAARKAQPAAPAASAPTARATQPRSEGPAVTLDLEDLLLLTGPAMGMLAAILQRSQEGLAPAPPTKKGGRSTPP